MQVRGVISDAYNKPSTSYGNCRGHSKKWWRLFIRKCNVLGVVKKELKSIIKQSQHYGIRVLLARLAKERLLLRAVKIF